MRKQETLPDLEPRMLHSIAPSNDLAVARGSRRGGRMRIQLSSQQAEECFVARPTVFAPALNLPVTVTCLIAEAAGL